MPLSPPHPCDQPSLDPGASPVLDTTAVGAAAPFPGWAPQRLSEVLIAWVQQHFDDADKIEHPRLKDRVWVPTEETPIVVGSLAEWKPNNSSQRPAVLIDRLDQQESQPQGVDQRLMGGCNRADSSLQYSSLWQGSHAVYCIGGREGEGDVLAGEVWSELMKFRPVIQEYLCLSRMRVGNVGKRTKLEEHKETWVVPIYVGYQYWVSWRLARTDLPTLRAVVASLGMSA